MLTRKFFEMPQGVLRYSSNKTNYNIALLAMGHGSSVYNIHCTTELITLHFTSCSLVFNSKVDFDVATISKQ